MADHHPHPLKVKRLLLIKYGALGDFIISFRALSAIRAHFPHAYITLLTNRAHMRLARASKWFNRVWEDDAPTMGRIVHTLKQRKRLIEGQFDLVIDLHNTDRSSLYYHLCFPRQPHWSGVARGSAYYFAQSRRRQEHLLDRDARQLASLGVETNRPLDLEWLRSAAGSKKVRMTANTVILCPNLIHHPRASWTVADYAALARRLIEHEKQVILMGDKFDSPMNARIEVLCPEMNNQTGKLHLLEIASYAQHAAAIIGTDSGYGHLLASCGGRAWLLPRAPIAAEAVQKSPLLPQSIEPVALHNAGDRRMNVEEVFTEMMRVEEKHD